jgi:hypothetical protein
MESTLFAELLASVVEADEILDGTRAPSREIHVNPVQDT